MDNQVSSVVTGGVTITAVTLTPLVSWMLNGFVKPIPDSVPLLIAAAAITIGHAVYNLVQSRLATQQAAQPQGPAK